MQEQLEFVVGEIRSALRFRWVGFGLAAVLCLGGWAYVAVMPNVYEAQARFILNTSSMLERALEDQIVETDPEVRLIAMREALFGRDVLATVARRAGLAAEVDSQIQFDAMIDSFQRSIEFESITPDTVSRTADRIYQIKYQHTDRLIALAVVDALLNAFFEGALGESRREEEQAIQSLDQQIAMAVDAVSTAEAEESDFKRRNADRLPGTQGAFQQRLDASEQQLALTRRNLNSLLSRLTQHDRQLEDLRQFLPSAAGELDPNSLPAQIRSHQLEYDRLRLRLTENHPDLVELRSAIDTLTQQYEQELAAAGVEAVDPGVLALEANPVYQEAQIARAETELAIAERQAEIRDLEAQIADLLSRRDESLANEAALALLEGNSENARAELVALRAARSELGRTVAVQQDSPVQYRPVNEPFASMIPVGPARLKYLFAVFVAALSAGGALCWVIAQIRPVFASASALRQYAELPVLGVVTNAWPATERSVYRRATLGYALALSMLVAVLAILAGLEVIGSGIHALVAGG